MNELKIGKKYKITGGIGVDWEIGQIVTIVESLGKGHYIVEEYSTAHDGPQLLVSSLYTFSPVVSKAVDSDNLEVGKKYRIVATNTICPDWEIGRIVTIKEIANKSVNHCIVEEQNGNRHILAKYQHFICANLYEFEEVEEGKSKKVINLDVCSSSAELHKVLANAPPKDGSIQINTKPVYVDNYKLILYYTNGKQFVANNVCHINSSFWGKDDDTVEDEYFVYMRETKDNKSYSTSEITGVDVKCLAGYAIYDKKEETWMLKVLKPSFYKKHTFRVGQKE